MNWTALLLISLSVGWYIIWTKYLEGKCRFCYKVLCEEEYTCKKDNRVACAKCAADQGWIINIDLASYAHGVETIRPRHLQDPNRPEEREFVDISNSTPEEVAKTVYNKMFPAFQKGGEISPGEFVPFDKDKCAVCSKIDKELRFEINGKRACASCLAKLGICIDEQEYLTKWIEVFQKPEFVTRDTTEFNHFADSWRPSKPKKKKKK